MPLNNDIKFSNFSIWGDMIKARVHFTFHCRQRIPKIRIWVLINILPLSFPERENVASYNKQILLGNKKGRSWVLSF